MTRSFNKTRIAPTPSGFLHLGNAFSFSLTAALAENAGASVLLRIDDIDRQRMRPAYVEDIFDTLHFLSIPWQEGPQDAREFEQVYSQRHRASLYQSALEELWQSGHLFACTCSRSSLQNGEGAGCAAGCRAKGLSPETPGASWRFCTTGHEQVDMHTLYHGVVGSTLPASMHDFIVRKKDGEAAYQLASLVDDVHLGVNGVVRGADLWPSTIAQLLLAGKLPAYAAFSHCIFFHHRLLETGGVKLSKSAGDTSIQHFRSEGKQAADVYRLIGQAAGAGDDFRHWRDFQSLPEQFAYRGE